EKEKRVLARRGPRRVVNPFRAAFLEEIFHDAVFERMERDDRQTPAAGEPRGELLQAFAERFQFAIDRDAERLKHARGGMRFAAARDDALDDSGEFERCRDWPIDTHTYDFFRDAARVRFLAEIAENAF